jgi:hypothetical protein
MSVVPLTQNPLNSDKNSDALSALSSTATTNNNNSSSILPSINFSNIFGFISKPFDIVFNFINGKFLFTFVYLVFFIILYLSVNKKNTKNVFQLYCIGFWIFCLIFIVWLSNPFDNKNTAKVTDAPATNIINNNKI